MAACTLLALMDPGLARAGQLDAPPPKLPDEPTPTTAPAVDPPPSPAPTSAPAMAEGPRAPDSRVEDKLSLTGGALWDGLTHQRVRLGLENGAELDGTVVAHSSSDIAISRTSDGTVVSVPKGEIQAVHLASQPSMDRPHSGPRPTDSGRRAYGGAVTMLVLGAPLSLSGTVMLGLCPPCAYIHLPLLLPGIGLIVGGSILLRRSKQKHDAFRKAWGIPMASRMRLTPNLALTRAGGQAGFTLQF